MNYELCMHACRHASSDAEYSNASSMRACVHRSTSEVDLHGCTQEEAFASVNQFLDQQWQAGHQLVLVITGKGTARDGGGVLRTAVPRWITEGRYRDCLVGIAAAESRDGGEGAIYVMLRKQR